MVRVLESRPKPSKEADSMYHCSALFWLHYQNVHFQKVGSCKKRNYFVFRQLADLHKENASKDSAVQVCPCFKIV